MNPPNSITFFSRFEADILAGKKTITLRDESESFYQAGQRVSVSNLEDGRCYGELDILSVSRVAFDDLNYTHAEQENMSLAELKTLIRQIYPGIEALYLIHFKLV
ncbi:N(4)-acetylcytidine aminohydrolase [Shewanella marinintestina]|uniref:N(4)-acetylcytidine aminohydrolase n=1 Tax=Shewanella marinintestina TaxID=190305 RepID=UPI00200CAC6C|nr:N(4)-acetylcytidine aminohydrolase [Shewanella marinintestina]MCL1146675.1 N(4)-acetylcytidine aminohydrolase [Shewanella marinintestina]